MKDSVKLARCARPLERARIFFPTAALLVGHQSGASNQMSAGERREWFF
jgi:hypothetical protein